MFGASVLDLEPRGQPPSLDLLAFFNTLDHQDEPLDALEKALHMAKYVLVELHGDAAAGKQHLFVINEALARTAKENNWSFCDFSDVIDVQPQGSADRLYLLSSRAEIRNDRRPRSGKQEL